MRYVVIKTLFERDIFTSSFCIVRKEFHQAFAHEVYGVYARLILLQGLSGSGLEINES